MKPVIRNNNYLVILGLSLLLIGLFTAFLPESHSPLRFSSAVNDTARLDYFLELKGNVRRSKSINEKEEIKPIDSTLVTVYHMGAIFIQAYTNKKGRCVFKLPLNKTYKIVVSKPGFTTKFFEVNCNVPSNKINTFSFSFDIDLFEEVKGLDVTILQKPIAKIAYNLIIEQFAYDIEYTSRINFSLKKMYKKYYLLQQKQADSLVVPPKNQAEQKK